MSRSRLLLALLLGVALGSAVIAAVLRAVSAPPASANVHPLAPLAPRFTTRLLLVIVDGLRYDVATDPRLMPRFSSAMREHASGEIWAGQISMTSSAILAIGTGQPGRLEQVIHNIDARRPPFNSWFTNARASGLHVATVGDRSWFDFYGGDLWKSRLDPEGVAIDVDFNPQTFRGARELLALSPDVLILHFGTPDHQGHAYGIRSRRYAEHIRGFDVDLAALLAEIDPGWTVVVTSDHGAADSGTHGTDVDIQRRSPIYAYGPGIARGQRLEQRASQLDLAATLSVLLGVPPPAHGLGHVLLPFLDASPRERARIGCENADRVLSYATKAASPTALTHAREELAGCASSGTDDGRAASALRSVRAAEGAVTGSTGLASPDTPLWLIGIALIALALGRVLLPEFDARGYLVVLLVLVIGVALVFEVERLPSVWPNVVRASVFAVTNGVLLLLALWPSATLAWLERRAALALALAPSALVVSYPADSASECFVIAVVLSVLYLGHGPLRAGLGRFFAGYRPRVPSVDVGALAVALVVLSPASHRFGGTYSGLLADGRMSSLGPALFSAGCLAWLAARLPAPRGLPLLIATLGAAAVLFRPAVGPFLGRSLFVGAVVAFVVSLQRRKLGWAVIAGAMGVLWVSRAFESLPLLACLVAATVTGRAVGVYGTRQLSAVFSRTSALLLVTIHFSLAYVLRVGVQDGLELGGMYWGAGAFNDPHVSPFVIGTALTFKYAMGVFLIGLCLRDAWPADRAPLAARASASCFALRSLALSGMFMLAGNSYWTAVRVLGDLPTALAMSLGSLGLVFLEEHLASAALAGKRI